MAVPSETLVGLIQNYGLTAVFLGMVLEEVLFVIPAAVIIVSSGAILVESVTLLPAMSEIFFEITLAGSLGITVGSYAVFAAGFYGGKPGINRLGRYLDISWEDVQRFESHFSSEREKHYLLFFRVLPIFPITTVSAAAGIFRMNWKPYTVITFFGMFPRHLFYAYLGWKASENYTAVLAGITRFSRTLTVLGAVCLVAYLLYYRHGRKTREHITQNQI